MTDIQPQAESLLPYHDTKPVGAADFYFAINATFRFILERFGQDGLERYWTELGRDYMAPVARAWAEHGAEGVARYWREFYAAEPGAKVDARVVDDAAVLDVMACPAIAHLREHGREIVPSFCQHCYFSGNATAENAGMALRVQGGNGICRQTVYTDPTTAPPQDLGDIREAR